MISISHTRSRFLEPRPRPGQSAPLPTWCSPSTGLRLQRSRPLQLPGLSALAPAKSPAASLKCFLARHRYAFSVASPGKGRFAPSAAIQFFALRGASRFPHDSRLAPRSIFAPVHRRGVFEFTEQKTAKLTLQPAPSILSALSWPLLTSLYGYGVHSARCIDRSPSTTDARSHLVDTLGSSVSCPGPKPEP